MVAWASPIMWIDHHTPGQVFKRKMFLVWNRGIFKLLQQLPAGWPASLLETCLSKQGGSIEGRAGRWTQLWVCTRLHGRLFTNLREWSEARNTKKNSAHPEHIPGNHTGGSWRNHSRAQVKKSFTQRHPCALPRQCAEQYRRRELKLR